MFIRFRAEHYEVDGKKFVDVYDHKTGRTVTFTLKQYHRYSKFLAARGGIIFGKKEW